MVRNEAVYAEKNIRMTKTEVQPAYDIRDTRLFTVTIEGFF